MSEISGKQVLLIPSRELGWSEVRRALSRLREVSRVHTAASLTEAVELASSTTLDAVMMGPLTDLDSELDKLAELRRILGEEAPIVLIAGDFDVDVVLALGQLGMTGYLLWADLTTDCLSRCLAPAVIDGFMVGSRTVGRAAIAAAQHRVSPSVDASVLTSAERMVLSQLAHGRTEQEIAATKYMSERSVRRLITSAKQKLGAPNLFLLGMAFMRLPLAHEPGDLLSED